MKHNVGNAGHAAVRSIHMISHARDGSQRSLTRPVGVRATSVWRERPAASDHTAPFPRVIAGRWRSLENQTLEVQAQTAVDSHLVCIALRRMNIRLSVSGHLVKEGTVTPGTLHVTEPGVSAECAFRGAYDALHLHIANELIAECANAFGGDDIRLPTDAAPSHDPGIERLGMNLLEYEQLGGMFGPMYADCLGTAIVARLLACRMGAANRETHTVAELAKWRLRRVFDYIDAHMDEPVRLADLAGAAGLTRMHFAAQFRAATGLRPHEYLLRRRVESAQVLLSKNVSTVNVALAVGFQSQAHFTQVFKRFVGQPPHTWRRRLCETSLQLPDLGSAAVAAA
jgi:AraC family transcriptional regulator